MEQRTSPNNSVTELSALSVSETEPESDEYDMTCNFEEHDSGKNSEEEEIRVVENDKQEEDAAEDVAPQNIPIHRNGRSKICQISTDDSTDDMEEELKERSMETNDKEYEQIVSIKESDGIGQEDKTLGWVTEFLMKEGHDILFEVPSTILKDIIFMRQFEDFVPHFKVALAMINDKPPPPSIAEKSFLDKCAGLLYAYAHSAYLMEPQGLRMMRANYLAFKYGKCPRVLCEGERVLPVGTSSIAGRGLLMLWCPLCNRYYTPQRPELQSLDGCFFGPNVGQLLLFTYPDLMIKRSTKPYVPRVFGFPLYDEERRLHQVLRSGKRKYISWSKKVQTDPLLIPPHRATILASAGISPEFKTLSHS